MSDSVKQNQDDEARALIQRHVDQLGEHFDSVHVFATRFNGEEDMTRGYNRASGNWFTRYGQIREWLVFEEEMTRNKARANPENAS